MRSFLANLLGLRRLLLGNAHDENGLCVPPAVAATINDGTVETTVKSLCPCLDLLFRVSAYLEADASPLPAKLGLFAGFVILLRSNTFALPDEVRAFLCRSFVSLFSLYSHRLFILAFHSDPFCVPYRQLVGTALCVTETLPMTRNRAVSFLCTGEDELEMAVTRELGSFLRFADGGFAESPAARLHPAT